MKIYIQARGSYETLLNLSTWAENNQIERIGLPDHYIVGKQRHDKNKGRKPLYLTMLPDINPFERTEWETLNHRKDQQCIGHKQQTSISNLSPNKPHT